MTSQQMWDLQRKIKELEDVRKRIEAVDFYEGNWECRESVEKDFEEKLDPSVHILYATYTYEDYSGNAFVLFTQGGKLFTVDGGHCSCYGLEGQWNPVEVSKETIQYILDNGTMFDEVHKQKLGEILRGL